jgi:hypothetical protein
VKRTVPEPTRAWREGRRLASPPRWLCPRTIALDRAMGGGQWFVSPAANALARAVQLRNHSPGNSLPHLATHFAIWPEHEFACATGRASATNPTATATVS